MKRNCSAAFWFHFFDRGLIGTLGWELIQMSDGTFKRPQVWELVGAGWLGAGWLVMLVGYIELMQFFDV